MQQQIRAIIIEDEPKAIEILERYCTQIESVELLQAFRDPLEGIQFINQNRVDLIFLDINMPKMNGMDLLDVLEEKPKVIFTTAYSEFAVESYSYNAIDYLLKPISFKRFFQAISKLQNQKISEPTAVDAKKNESDGFLYVKSGTQLHKIRKSEILFLEKEGNYLIFHTVSKKVLSRQNMKDIQDVLDTDEFIKVHKSFIIAKSHVEIIESNQLRIKNHTVPIGRNFKSSIDQLL